MSILKETEKILDEARARSPSILVGYSDGKDSRVVLDLCVHKFDHVEGFFMALVPGLECIEHGLEEARRRYGIKIFQIPHWITRKFIANGLYCTEWFGYDDLPEWRLQDCYAFAMAESGINCVATGAKASDSAWRRRFMSSFRPEQVINPIKGWHKYDVISYLRARNIPLPPSSGKSATGIDLSTDSLLWLHDTFPADFKKLCNVFPFAEAVVWRRKFYG